MPQAEHFTFFWLGPSRPPVTSAAVMPTARLDVTAFAPRFITGFPQRGQQPSFAASLNFLSATWILLYCQTIVIANWLTHIRVENDGSSVEHPTPYRLNF